MQHLMTQYRVAIHARIPTCTTITKKLSRFIPQAPRHGAQERWRHILQTPWRRADLSVHDNGAGRAICLQGHSWEGEWLRRWEKARLSMMEPLRVSSSSTIKLSMR